LLSFTLNCVNFGWKISSLRMVKELMRNKALLLGKSPSEKAISLSSLDKASRRKRPGDGKGGGGFMSSVDETDEKADGATAGSQVVASFRAPAVESAVFGDIKEEGGGNGSTRSLRSKSLGVDEFENSSDFELEGGVGTCSGGGNSGDFQVDNPMRGKGSPGGKTTGELAVEDQVETG
jgi:hypothetical protein